MEYFWEAELQGSYNTWVGINGGAQPDKWKHVLQTVETIECQHKDADRGANLVEVHEDRH